jgi:uncharacterized protein YdhG (YjbR/CyaY superfamily)
MLPADPTVDAYVAQVDEGRRDAVRTLRDLCRSHLEGFTEGMKYGMPGYWRGPVQSGELEIGFAAQKQYLSFYVLRTDVMAAHLDRLGGLDLGRGASVTAVPTTRRGRGPVDPAVDGGHLRADLLRPAD